MDAFAEGRLDVLVGTSLVTKGLDMPEVTLVGVVSADIALTLPDERAAERTYQLLAQAIGRAGAARAPGAGDHPDLPAGPPGDPGGGRRRRGGLLRRRAGPPAAVRRRRRSGALKLTVGRRGRRRGPSRGRSAWPPGCGDRPRERRSIAVAVVGPAPAYVAPPGRPLALERRPPGRDPQASWTATPGPPWSVDVDPESLL